MQAAHGADVVVHQKAGDQVALPQQVPPLLWVHVRVFGYGGQKQLLQLQHFGDAPPVEHAAHEHQQGQGVGLQRLRRAAVQKVQHRLRFQGGEENACVVPDHPQQGVVIPAPAIGGHGVEILPPGLVPPAIAAVIVGLPALGQGEKGTLGALLHHMVEAIGAAVGQVGDESVLPGEGGQDLLCVLVPGDFSGHIHGELISQAHHRQEFPLAGGQGVDHGGGEHGINVRAAVGQGTPLGQGAQIQIDGGKPPLAGIEQGLDLPFRELGPAPVGIDGQFRVIQPQLIRADETQPPPQADGLRQGEKAVPAGHDKVDRLGQPVGQGTQKGGGSAIGEQMEVVDEDIPGCLPGKGPA